MLKSRVIRTHLWSHQTDLLVLLLLLSLDYLLELFYPSVELLPLPLPLRRLLLQKPLVTFYLLLQTINLLSSQFQHLQDNTQHSNSSSDESSSSFNLSLNPEERLSILVQKELIQQEHFGNHIRGGDTKRQGLVRLKFCVGNFWKNHYYLFCFPCFSEIVHPRAENE